MRLQPTGPRNAVIMIIGEAPGAEEEQKGIPFVGSSGHELTQMLSLAGIERSSCFITNVLMERPANNDITLFIDKDKKKLPEGWTRHKGKAVSPFAMEELGRLHSEIQALNPRAIIALGNTALWAVCGIDSVSKWRGSHLSTEINPGTIVIPAYHPAAVLRQYSWRAITIQDFRRAKRESISQTPKPNYQFLTGLPFKEIKYFLEDKLAKLAEQPATLVVDLEISRNEILCVGIGFSRTEAICIPFLCTKGFYFSDEEHVEIVTLLYKLLTHPNARVCNQNLSFDIQYLFWRFSIWPSVYFDTMVAQNVIFPGTPKSLDYLASMYCDYYVYWKDDGKFWKKLVSDEVIWHYNCLDCAYTFEVMEKQQAVLEKSGLVEQAIFMFDLLNRTLRMMARGVRVNEVAKHTLKLEIKQLMETLHSEVAFMSGENLVGEKGNFSSQRLAKFFYGKLGFEPIYKVAKGVRSITCEDEALVKLSKKHGWIKPITERINIIRSYKTALDVCDKRSDKDERWRCNFNVAGTANFRFSSSENPFGSGLNLQNLTTGKDIA